MYKSRNKKINVYPSDDLFNNLTEIPSVLK